MSKPACARPELSQRLVELLGAASTDGELRAHADGCEACRTELARLRESWNLLTPLEPDAPSQAVLVRARLRPKPRAGLGLAGALGLAAIATLTIAIGVLPALGLTVWLSTALSIAAYVLGLSAASGRRGAELPFYGVTTLGLALGVMSVPGSGWAPPLCLAFATAVALVPLAITGVALYRTEARGAVAGAFWGAAAGVLGAAVWRLHCPAPGWAHALMFHAMAVPIAAAVGALLARFVFGARRATAWRIGRRRSLASPAQGTPGHPPH